jgi:hypothetical protein
MLFCHLTLQLQKKPKDREEEVKKKGLSATPSCTLPWPAKSEKEFTMCVI